MLRSLKARREAFLDANPDVDGWRSKWFSASTYALWQAARAPTASVARGGRVLDAGSGRGSWRRVIVAGGGEYESIDLAPRGDFQPTWVGDVSDMSDVPTARYDVVVCHQVLEHLPRPWCALREFHRVLRPGGSLIVSAPHLSRRHELPHDYFRFTQEGLASLLADAGFDAADVRAVGGVLCFLHHQFSCLVVSPLAAIPLLGACASLLNAPLSWVFSRLDSVLDPRGLAANGVLASARRGATA